MNPLTLEWIEKAEGDFLTAGREFRARNAPNYDAVQYRYPGQTADILDAKSALSAAKRVRFFVKAKLHQG
jgi:hypothetical protein